MFAKINYYRKRMMQLGPSKTTQAVRYRLRGALVERYWRYKVLRNCASVPCYVGFSALRPVNFVRSLYTLSHEDIIARADNYTKNCFSILGSGTHCFTKIPWHADFRLQAQHAYAEYQFDKKLFYKDIRIETGKGAVLVKDIKVPWELSRFQHGYILGLAYSITGDERYAEAFVRQVNDWLDQNIFLCGPNWLSPMEVSVRAINWIVAYEFFKDSSVVTDSFWQRFIRSLHDHRAYLEHTWEIIPVPQERYNLTDLIGYCYLGHFFNGERIVAWCYQQILQEFDERVFDEGADYEGSTKHHLFVTENFYHFYKLCQERGLSLPEGFVEKLHAMVVYAWWLTDHAGNHISIGDNDSGSLLLGGLPRDDITTINPAHIQHDVAHYAQVGVSCIKTTHDDNNQWHITVRHHAYHQKQPSSHMHNDAGSITLSLRGIPLIIDPGTFIYTPSTIWRNQFRSVSVHNTFSVHGIEPVNLDHRLFALDLPSAQMIPQSEGLVIRTQHALYARLGLTAQRVVALNDKRSCMTIIDEWEAITHPHDLLSSWNFTLAPGITVERADDGIVLLHHDTPMLLISSPDLLFEIGDTWISLDYGSKVRSKRLNAKAPIEDGKRYTIMMRVL